MIAGNQVLLKELAGKLSFYFFFRQFFYPDLVPKRNLAIFATI